MAQNKKGEVLSRIDWSEINDLLLERCSYLKEELEEPLGLSELLGDLTQYYPDINDQAILYWGEAGILQPVEGKKGSRVVAKYPAEQVRRAHLAAILADEKYNLAPSIIAGAASAWFARDLTATAEFAVDLREFSRARLMLVGRLLGVIVSLVTGLRSPPPDCILVCREMPDEATAYPHDGSFPATHYFSEEVRRFLDPQRMLIGFTKNRQDPEILVQLDKLGDLVANVGGREYVGIKVYLGNECPPTEVIIGLRRGVTGVAQSLLAALDRGSLSVPLDPPQRQLLARLLRYVFDVVIKFQDALSTIDPRHSIPKNADLLSVLLTAVLLAATDRWDYAAFLAPTAGEVLCTVAHSSTYPLYARGTMQALDPGRHPESWVFTSRQPIIVESLADLGADMVNTSGEPAQGFAIVPGLAGGEVRGVLYVGAGKAASMGRSPFSSSDVSLLHLLASIITEAYTREQLSSVVPLIETMPRPDVPYQTETALRLALHNLLVEEVGPAFARGDPNRLLTDEYLVLITVRVLGISNPTALHLFTSKIASRMEQFIRDHTASYPGFRRAGHFIYWIDNDRLVGILGRVHGDARHVTETISKELEPVTSLIEGAKVLTWRLYYSYDRLGRDLLLRNEVDDAKVDEWIDYIVDGVKDTLATLEYITSANTYMDGGQYEQAATQLEEARLRDPGNAYILRHLAQAYFHLGKYDLAVELGQQTVEADEREGRDYAGSYLWLGKALLGAGHHRDGLKQLHTAVALSETPLYVESYVEALLQYGTGDEHQRAIELIDSVLDTTQPMGADRAWLYALKGEVLRELKRIQDALRSFEMAIRYDPANRALCRILERLQVETQVQRRDSYS